MRRWMTVLLALAAAAGIAEGQARPTQGGRELDANPQLGGGGRNSILSVDPSRSLSGNLYITGQVTGGFSFRGSVPYVGGNELRLTLPSESLDNFNRDSIGIQSVLGGRSYRPQPYYRPSSTVYSLKSGVTAASVAPEAALGQAYPPLNVPGGAPTLGEGMISHTRLLKPSILPSAQMGQLALSRGPLPSVVGTESETASRPRISALFGILRNAESRSLMEALKESGPDTEPLEQAQLPPGETPGEGAGEAEAGAQPITSEAGDQPSDMGLPSRPDDDVFDEMIRELVWQRNEQFRAGAIAPRSQPGTDLEALDRDPSERKKAQRRSRSVLVETADNRIILHGLAGRGTDPFNRHMSAGDTKLSKGRFYQAAAHYETAQQANRTNPLAPAGAGLAYFGAGESYRASHFLQRALRLFPALMGVRIDIDGILGKEATDKRLAELEQRLGRSTGKAKTSLMFLATFIHANRGDMQRSRAWAEKLASLAGDDPILAAYAQRVIAIASTTSAP